MDRGGTVLQTERRAARARSLDATGDAAARALVCLAAAVSFALSVHMSNPALFAVGLAVSLIVAGALGLLAWGAVLDGRAARERRLEAASDNVTSLSRPHSRRPAA
jgi:hypothetical protein